MKMVYLGMGGLKNKAMIQPNELRIGNWVKVSDYFNTPIKTELRGKPYQYKAENYRMVEYFNPIPLTEYVLLKCGFEKIDSNAFHIDNLGQLFLENDSAYFYFNGKKIYVKYLHQLQNLYFALTNQELEIEL